MEGLPGDAIIADELKPDDIQQPEDPDSTAMDTSSLLDSSSVSNVRQLSSLGGSSAMTSASRISGYFCHVCQVNIGFCAIYAQAN